MDKEALMNILKERFTEHTYRHPEVEWEEVEERLLNQPQIIEALLWMEESGGEPDLVVSETFNNHWVYVDMSRESPPGRRSLCYDQGARLSRKKHPPQSSVMELVEEHQLNLLNEDQYRKLQERDAFDLKTSSWILTEDELRALGGALFCDRRYNQVFVYHNGADSYYSSRGFRAYVKL